MKRAEEFLNLDSLLTTEGIKIREMFREFVDSEITPHVNSWFEKEIFPIELVKQFANLNALGPTIPKGQTSGFSHSNYGIMMQEIERGDSGLRSFASVQGALVMHPIWKFGTEDQKAKYLENLRSGEMIGCFGLTEPDHGSNPAGMTTRITKIGNSYSLNGHKKWLTNGTLADIALIWAKNDDDKVVGIIVDPKSSGVEVRPIKKKFSLRVSDSSEFLFNDVKIDSSQLLNVQGFKGPFECLNLARFGIAWGSNGAAMSCYEEALNYSTRREQFGKPLAAHQLVQSKLVNMLTEICKSQLLSIHLGKLWEKEKIEPHMISMAKMNNVSAALDVARAARDILGANGVTSDFHSMRHMCNLETVNTYEGTEDIHKLIVGQKITEQSAFS